jgi:hypothetical protein
MNLIGKNMDSSEYELTDEQLRKVLHEPVGPYVLEAYNTELHLVEGLVLAALFYVITIQPHITLPIVCNLIICVGFVITFWYGILTNVNMVLQCGLQFLIQLFPFFLVYFK